MTMMPLEMMMSSVGPRNVCSKHTFANLHTLLFFLVIWISCGLNWGNYAVMQPYFLSNLLVVYLHLSFQNYLTDQNPFCCLILTIRPCNRANRLSDWANRPFG